MSSETSPCHSGLASERPLINREYGDLTPRRVFDLCPPLLIKERGDIIEEGLSPLRASPLLWSSDKGESKRGEAPLYRIIPPPFPREGDKGGGLPNKY